MIKEEMKITLVGFFIIIFNILMAGMAMSVTPPGPNEVFIFPNSVGVPLGYIVLVRKDSEFCAVKFTEIQRGKTDEDWLAKYESYYQGDKTGDFSNKKNQVKKGRLSSSKGFGIGRFSFDFGNKDIECGPIKLQWTTVGLIYFYSRAQHAGDYGIELAPTKWTDVSQVNVLDQRLKWYRLDPKRKDISIPIDEFWEEKEQSKTP